MPAHQACFPSIGPDIGLLFVLHAMQSLLMYQPFTAKGGVYDSLYLQYLLRHAQSHAHKTLLCSQSTVTVSLVSFILFSVTDCCHHLGCADFASLPSIMHTQSTASRRIGRGDACASLGCADVLKTCSERLKEGTSAAKEVSVPRKCSEVHYMVWKPCVPCNIYLLLIRHLSVG